MFGYFPLQVHFCQIAKTVWHNVLKLNDLVIEQAEEKLDKHDDSARSVQKLTKKPSLAELVSFPAPKSMPRRKATN